MKKLASVLCLALMVLSAVPASAQNNPGGHYNDAYNNPGVSPVGTQDHAKQPPAAKGETDYGNINGTAAGLGVSTWIVGAVVLGAVVAGAIVVATDSSSGSSVH